jgi:hypothetical protein
MKDIGAAFKFQFRDRNWPSKMLLGSLFEFLSILLVGQLFVIGYQIEVIRRVTRHEENPLAEWDRLSEKFLTGLKLFIVSIIYFIPVFIILFPVLFFFLFSAITQSEEAAAFGSLTFVAIIILVVLPYSLFVSILTPVIYMRYALTDRMGEALNVPAVLKFFKQNWVNVVILALIMLGINFLAALGFLFCIVGIFFTTFYAKLVSAHLTGQLYLASPEAQTVHTEAVT